MANVGIVGLGEMGSGMAERLLKAGHRVTGWNRTRAKAARLEADGLSFEGSPREVAEKSELTITMVTDTTALEAVLDGTDGILAGLKSGKILVDMSTSAPTFMTALGERVAARGAQLLDAPVLGSILTLREGHLLIMVGGDQQAFDTARPILASIGETVRYIGQLGQAKALKVAANLNLAVQLIGFFEGILLAEQMGIDRRVAFETLLSGVIASPHMKYRAPFVLDPPDHAWFDCDMMQKDLQLALDLGREKEVMMPTTAISQQLLNSARALGYGKEDFASVFHVLAAMAGIERTPESIPSYSR
jgi:3-hydroxyisobutyrate dehydrogenase-like beta-hydroxyacid dehydrogenase